MYSNVSLKQSQLHFPMPTASEKHHNFADQLGYKKASVASSIKHLITSAQNAEVVVIHVNKIHEQQRGGL